MTGINRNKLRGLRAEKKLTQKQVSEALNISETSYIFKEQGKRQFTDVEIFLLAKLLQVEISYFFTN